MREFADLNALASCVGQVLAVSDWLRIEPARVLAFAEATEDRQWIHLDGVRAARESPYGGAVAHGFLTLSLLPCLLARCVRVHGVSAAINYGIDRLRFPAAVPVSSNIRASFHLSAFASLVAPAAAGAQVEWTVTVDCQDVSKPVCVAVWLVRYQA